VRTLKIGKSGSSVRIASRRAEVVSATLRAERTSSVARLVSATDGLGT
jgi:hypothetical protein